MNYIKTMGNPFFDDFSELVTCAGKSKLKQYLENVDSILSKNCDENLDLRKKKGAYKRYT